MRTIKEIWLTAPDGQFAIELKYLIEEWDDEPTATQLLKTLDYCAAYAGASTFTMQALNMMYESALTAEGTARSAVETLATLGWRASIHTDISL